MQRAIKRTFHQILSGVLLVTSTRDKEIGTSEHILGSSGVKNGRICNSNQSTHEPNIQQPHLILLHNATCRPTTSAISSITVIPRP